MFVVHVLLLTHEFIYNVICLPHSWYPQCDIPCFSRAQIITQVNPPLWINAVGWSWQMLDCFYWIYSVLQCRKQRRSFFPSPSSHTFWLVAYSVNSFGKGAHHGCTQPSLISNKHMTPFSKAKCGTTFVRTRCLSTCCQSLKTCIMLMNTRCWMGG